MTGSPAEIYGLQHLINTYCHHLELRQKIKERLADPDNTSVAVIVDDGKSSKSIDYSKRHDGEWSDEDGRTDWQVIQEKILSTVETYLVKSLEQCRIELRSRGIDPDA